jgi:SAM-dependent methyltransferase
MPDSTQRFSSRVDNYVKYRPSYPPALLDLLRTECGLTVEAAIADIGSGTGLLAQLFLANGNRVYGVEPNCEMREAGERLLARYPNFTSVAATAEDTTLPDHIVDFVTAGQAFHWFDKARTPLEFARILKLPGWIVLVWNERRIDSSPFQIAYEQLLQTYGTDYREGAHHQLGLADFRAYFQSESFHVRTLENRQVFDLEGLTGRLLSSSYAPEVGQPNQAPMLRELKTIFAAHQVAGRVTFEYNTKVYYARLSV